ncbi:M28 family peptidase [Sphingomonas radiodurans]|uniref:M28 family peptidase n=1 Tax=Sphingomonas radiodurans TaxID=2890321 RepID=UPI001E5A67F2|nr:M28 family peptidase [Sphingomonas radiodurans]WBH15756.1 M20/M25/M40 family metallo-hydrolase [Sphingomonas radiodurans]
MLWTDQTDRIAPFALLAKDWQARGVAWTDPDGTRPDPGAPLLAIMSFAGAEKLFAGSPVAWQTAREDDTASRPAKTGPLAVAVAMRKRYDLERISSSNVVGRLQGSDPNLADQVVILSAHLDHIGVTGPATGDTINNGAMDNAAGVASLIEAARLFQIQKKRPRRSVLFLAVTGEEKNLIGSEFYVSHPTVPKENIVANVNLDMPILTYRFIDLVAFGAERSGIGPVVAQVAKGKGLALVPDPNPGQANFVRTDHYNFVRQGIPAISLATGPGGPGKAAFEDFFARHYHQPSDDISLPFDWTAGREFVKVNYLIAKTIADAADRPRWVKGDYFGTLYQGPMSP